MRTPIGTVLVWVAGAILGTLSGFEMAAQSVGTWLPSSVYRTGANGAEFHSDVRLLNQGNAAVTVNALFYDQATGQTFTATPFPIAARSQAAFDNVLRSLFGRTLAQGSYGPIRLQATGPIVVSSSVNNVNACGTGAVSGQWLPGIDAKQAMKAGTIGQLAVSSNPSTGYRTNVVFTNPGTQAATVSATVRKGDGSLLSSGTIGPLGANGFSQVVLDSTAVFPGVAGTTDTDLWLEFASDQPLLSFASVINNASGDPFAVVATPDAGVGTPPGQTGVWTNGGPYGGPPSAFAINPRTPSTLYAATSVGVFKSTDSGGTWAAAIITGLPTLSLAINPTAPSTLYAGTVVGVYKSTDSGGSWVQANTGLRINDPVLSLAINPTTPSTLYAGTYSGGVYKSTDSGGTWVATRTGSSVWALAVNPTTPSTLFAGGSGPGVYKSTDSGGTWTLKKTGLPKYDYAVWALAIDPTTPSTLYAGLSQFGVYKSTDSGDTWAATVNLTNQTIIFALAINPATPSTLCAGTYHGVLKSTDSGVTWAAANTGLPTHKDTDWNLSFVDSIGALAIDPTTPSTLYAGTNLGGVFKSNDSGSAWTSANTGLTALPINALAINPASPSTLYTGTSRGAFKSTNWGGTWAAANTGIGSDAYPLLSLAIDPSTPSTLYAGMYWGVFKSTDSGGTWVRDPGASMPPTFTKMNQVNTLAINPAVLSTVYAGTDRGIFRSTDSARTWTAINNGFPGGNTSSVFSLAINPTTPSTLYVGTRTYGVYRSTDSGDTWAAANTGLMVLPPFSVFALAINPKTPSTLYAGTGVGVFKSTDSGGTWTAAKTGLPATTVWAFAIDPTSPSTLYAGTSVGVFESTDSGATWTAAGLSGYPVYALAIDGTASVLYAGTDVGVWQQRLAKGANASFDLEPMDEPAMRADVPGFATRRGMDRRPHSGRPAPQPAAASAGSWILPSSVYRTGVNGAEFHSDVRLLNQGNAAVTVNALFYDQATGQTFTATPFPIAARSQASFDNILHSLFGRTLSQGSYGPIRFQATGPIVVSSSVNNVNACGTGAVSGQWLPGIDATQAMKAGTIGQLAVSSDPSTGYRTNVVFTNPGTQAATASARVRRGDGSLLSSGTIGPLAANGFSQVVLDSTAVFPGVAGATDTDLWLEFTSDQPLLSFASVINNASGDPFAVVATPDSVPDPSTMMWSGPARVTPLPTRANARGLAALLSAHRERFFRVEMPSPFD